MATPSGHTSDGGVLVGDPEAGAGLVLFEDPQCPYCREFEEVDDAFMTGARTARELVVEYRMRCFLGPESVRADNALALAAESGRFDELRRALFAQQPPEGSGGFTTEDLVRLGAQVGLTGADYVSGVEEGRYEEWVRTRGGRATREKTRREPRRRGSMGVRSTRKCSSTRERSSSTSAPQAPAPPGDGRGPEGPPQVRSARSARMCPSSCWWMVASSARPPRRPPRPRPPPGAPTVGPGTAGAPGAPRRRWGFRPEVGWRAAGHAVHRPEGGHPSFSSSAIKSPAQLLRWSKSPSSSLCISWLRGTLRLACLTSWTTSRTSLRSR